MNSGKPLQHRHDPRLAVGLSQGTPDLTGAPFAKPSASGDLVEQLDQIP